MHVFKDKKNHEWTIELTYGATKRIRAVMEANGDKVDLAALGEDPDLAPRLLNPAFVCDIVYLLVKPQADVAGITDEQFGELLTGPTIADVIATLNAELTDFFRCLGRTDVVQLLTTQRKLLEAIVAENVRSILKIETAEIDTNPATSTNSSTVSLESSESIPTGTHSDSSTTWPSESDSTNGTGPVSSPALSTMTLKVAESA